MSTQGGKLCFRLIIILLKSLTIIYFLFPIDLILIIAGFLLLLHDVCDFMGIEFLAALIHLQIHCISII